MSFYSSASSVVDQLDTADDPNRPGMLLGKIQSGKTRAFLGVIARAFDRGYDDCHRPDEGY